MAVPFLAPLRPPVLATAPSSPVTGDCYVSNVDGHLYCYDGSDWVDCGQGGGAVGIDCVSGFVASSTSGSRRGYTRGSDPLSATESFTAVAMFSPTVSDSSLSTAPRQIFGTRGTASDAAGGWGIQIEPGVNALRNARVRVTVQDNGNSPRIGYIDLPLLVNKWAVAHLTWQSAGVGAARTIKLYVNGAMGYSNFNGSGGGQYTAGGNMCVGVYNDGIDSSDSGSFPGVIHGAGYATSVMTDQEVATHAEACMAAGQLVQTASGTALADGWRASVAGSNPDATTWDSFLSGTPLTALNTTALTLATKSSVRWV